MSRFWEEHAKAIDLDRFRATDQYLWQPDSYPYGYLTRILLEKVECERLRAMGEDDAFGCRVEDVSGYAVSRDLLDSLMEIRFLEKHLPRFGVRTALDIGAGYGRLAHRLGQTHPELDVICTDAVTVSLTACARYRRYRGGRWMIRSPEVLREDPVALSVDVAINVHSWSECTASEVDWWIGNLADARTPWVFVIPHDRDFSTAHVRTPPSAPEGRLPLDEPDGRIEFRSVIESHGYKIAAADEPALDGRHYYLFRLRA